MSSSVNNMRIGMPAFLFLLLSIISLGVVEFVWFAGLLADLNRRGLGRISRLAFYIYIAFLVWIIAAVLFRNVYSLNIIFMNSSINIIYVIIIASIFVAYIFGISISIITCRSIADKFSSLTGQRPKVRYSLIVLLNRLYVNYFVRKYYDDLWFPPAR